MSNLNDPFDAEKDIWSEESPTAQDTTANPDLVKPGLVQPSLAEQRIIVGDARGNSIPTPSEPRTPQQSDAAAVGSDNTLNLDNNEDVMTRCAENAILARHFRY